MYVYIHKGLFDSMHYTHTHTMEYYSALKKEILLFQTTQTWRTGLTMNEPGD